MDGDGIVSSSDLRVASQLAMRSGASSLQSERGLTLRAVSGMGYEGLPARATDTGRIAEPLGADTVHQGRGMLAAELLQHRGQVECIVWMYGLDKDL